MNLFRLTLLTKVALTPKLPWESQVRMEDVHNLLEGSRCFPCGGATHCRAWLPAFRGETVRCFREAVGEEGTRGQPGPCFLGGWAVTGTACTFPPSSRDPGRPGKALKVNTEATHRISQRPHLVIFFDLDRPWVGSLKGKVISGKLLNQKHTTQAGNTGLCLCDSRAAVSRGDHHRSRWRRLWCQEKGPQCACARQFQSPPPPPQTHTHQAIARPVF